MRGSWKAVWGCVLGLLLLWCGCQAEDGHELHHRPENAATGSIRANGHAQAQTGDHDLRRTASQQDYSHATGGQLSHQHHPAASSKRLTSLIVTYSVLIVLASLGGGWLPQFIQLTHTRMQLIVSLVAGLMLGIGVFHMLPHAIAEMGSPDRVAWWMMMGVLTMFFLLRAFHFHQHGSAKEAEPAEQHSNQEQRPNQGHHVSPGHGHSDSHSHKLSWIGVAFGLSVHTLIDGIALAASVQSDASHGAAASLFGLGTFLAILLHKPLDAVSITSLMAAGRWSAGWRHAVNAGFAMMCPLGAALFFLGMTQFAGQQQAVLGCALAFSAGVFLCISLGDLLPEIEFHSHDRIKLSVMILIGLSAAYLIGFLEPEHAHHHEKKCRKAGAKTRALEVSITRRLCNVPSAGSR